MEELLLRVSLNFDLWYGICRQVSTTENEFSLFWFELSHTHNPMTDL